MDLPTLTPMSARQLLHLLLEQGLLTVRMIASAVPWPPSFLRCALAATARDTEVPFYSGCPPDRVRRNNHEGSFAHAQDLKCYFVNAAAGLSLAARVMPF